MSGNERVQDKIAEQLGAQPKFAQAQRNYQTEPLTSSESPPEPGHGLVGTPPQDLLMSAQARYAAERMAVEADRRAAATPSEYPPEGGRQYYEPEKGEQPHAPPQPTPTRAVVVTQVANGYFIKGQTAFVHSDGTVDERVEVTDSVATHEFEAARLVEWFLLHGNFNARDRADEPGLPFNMTAQYA